MLTYTFHEFVIGQSGKCAVPFRRPYVALA
jgi:hypothetical protein